MDWEPGIKEMFEKITAGIPDMFRKTVEPMLLEASKNRVIVLDKDPNTGDASYSGQYMFDGLTDVRDIYFDKGNNRLYLLDAQHIYEITI